VNLVNANVFRTYKKMRNILSRETTIHIKPVLLLTGMLTLFSCQKESTPDLQEDPLSTFELEPGFKIELLASEPLIGDPVDMEIDEFGRLYVVEMPGYPWTRLALVQLNCYRIPTVMGEWIRALYLQMAWCCRIVSCDGKKVSW